jgi:hypothetical protein
MGVHENNPMKGSSPGRTPSGRVEAPSSEGASDVANADHHHSFFHPDPAHHTVVDILRREAYWREPTT